MENTVSISPLFFLRVVHYGIGHLKNQVLVVLVPCVSTLAASTSTPVRSATAAAFVLFAAIRVFESRRWR